MKIGTRLRSVAFGPADYSGQWGLPSVPMHRDRLSSEALKPYLVRVSVEAPAHRRRLAALLLLECVRLRFSAERIAACLDAAEETMPSLAKEARALLASSARLALH
jgi:hypothetical protein